MAIPNYAWVLPRPAKSRYKGAFPLYFEQRLIQLLFGEAGKHKLILQPFGGKAEYGIRTDLNASTEPDIVADAHYLPFPDNTFDLVIFDPPYSKQEAEDLYNTPYIKINACINETSRVCKPKGYIALYHRLMLPRPPNTQYHSRIFIGTRMWHEGRICGIFRKYPQGFQWKQGMTNTDAFGPNTLPMLIGD